VTGVPPAVHGISGNYFLDAESGQEVMMNEPHLLRAPTLFAAFAAQGAKIVVITAKDKLRRLLGHGLNMAEGNHVCFSAEHADQVTRERNGISDTLSLTGMAVPSVYSAALSEFVFAAGVKLLTAHSPDLMYLSTTDYVQHKHAPGAGPANEFYAMMDGYLATLDAAGATIAITADHGMNAKHDENGNANVVYLQDCLNNEVATTTKVILPITDPYVVHHGALGSFATVYVTGATNLEEAVNCLAAQPGVAEVLLKADAAERFELPADRLGDLVVISDKSYTLGTRCQEHDLSALDAPLRSHGGTSEQRVPLILNRKLTGVTLARPRNFDAFYLALNCIPRE
ncbi:MAG: phosphonoacetate hydrolase, partial [Chromatiales bacterium]|nr:phosphonoacetate hydrolase [Chromatiales bacterium]